MVYFPVAAIFCIISLVTSHNPWYLWTLKRKSSGSLKGLLEPATFTISPMPLIYDPTATTEISTPIFFRLLALGMVSCFWIFDWPSVISKTFFSEETRPPRTSKIYDLLEKPSREYRSLWVLDLQIFIRGFKRAYKPGRELISEGAFKYNEKKRLETKL